MLETRDAARRRGAEPVAVVGGYGLSGDAFHETSPDPKGTGIARAFTWALAGMMRQNDRRRFPDGEADTLQGKPHHPVADAAAHDMAGDQEDSVARFAHDQTMGGNCGLMQAGLFSCRTSR